MKLAQSWSHLALHVSSHHICTALSLGLLGDLRCLAEAGLLCLVTVQFSLCHCCCSHSHLKVASSKN
ncbi:hypothetical protein CesoFtcFv8_009927 [Champsocephalus esox]|uniref:Secreted protein n=1 Tax=Champsocephalus esox TaxID=159716 RepID=A0AAN8C4B5_9TELE|nr:hypothetical protein CesoFtcFv8_009927 [Champsocephalus esox]